MLLMLEWTRYMLLNSVHLTIQSYGPVALVEQELAAMLECWREGQSFLACIATLLATHCWGNRRWSTEGGREGVELGMEAV